MSFREANPGGGATEVAQQSRIRHKEDFIIAFSPVVAEATAIAYKGAPADLQGKIRRVVEVWKDRAIFEPPIQGAIDARLDGESAWLCRSLLNLTDLLARIRQIQGSI